MRIYKLRGIIATLFAVIGVLLPAGPAVAALGECNVAHQIFAYGNVLLSNSNGTTNRIYFQQRNLDADCKALALSTAHSARGIPNSAASGDLIEIGWQRFRNADGTVTKCMYWNKAVGGSPEPHWSCGNINDFDYGEYDRWRAQNPSGTTDWKVFSDLNDDGSFNLVHTFTSTWTQGYPLGETERKGNDTGMQEDQRSLAYYTNAGNWNSWPDALCGWDGDPTWEWLELSATRYITQQAPDQCAP